MTSLDRKAAARDRAAGTVRPPGYELLSNETRAAAIETVTKKLRKEVAAATGLPEGVDLHLLEFLVLKPQFPTVEFLQLIEKQRKREYDDKFWDWRRREVDPYVEKVVAAAVQKIEEHVQKGTGGQQVFCILDEAGGAPKYPQGWYSHGEKKHVSIGDLVKSAVAGIGFSVLGEVVAGGEFTCFTVAWGDAVAKQGAAGEPKAKRARDNGNSAGSEGGFAALREIRQARDQVAAEIIKSIKITCLTSAANGYSTARFDFHEEADEIAEVQELHDEMMRKHAVDILEANEMGDIWNNVVVSLQKEGYEVEGTWGGDRVLEVNWDSA